jgi:hypothetical protein
MSFWSFSIDRAATNAFCRCSWSESKSTRAWCRNRSFISAFNEWREECFMFFFVVDEIFNARDRVKFDSFMKRAWRLLKIVDSWTIVAFLIRAWARLKFLDVFEIDRDSCSVCSLFCRTLCESSTTYIWLAYNIVNAFVIDSDVNRWKRRVFRSRESKRV